MRLGVVVSLGADFFLSFFFFFARKLGRCSSDIFLHGPEPAQN